MDINQLQEDTTLLMPLLGDLLLAPERGQAHTVVDPAVVQGLLAELATAYHAAQQATASPGRPP